MKCTIIEAENIVIHIVPFHVQKKNRGLHQLLTQCDSEEANVVQRCRYTVISKDDLKFQLDRKDAQCLKYRFDSSCCYSKNTIAKRYPLEKIRHRSESQSDGSGRGHE